MRTREMEQVRYNWITTGEAGLRLGGISPEQVRKLGRRGVITMKDVNEGGAQPSWRVDPKSVDAYNERNTIGADAA